MSALAWVVAIGTLLWSSVIGWLLWTIITGIKVHRGQRRGRP